MDRKRIDIPAPSTPLPWKNPQGNFVASMNDRLSGDVREVRELKDNGLPDGQHMRTLPMGSAAPYGAWFMCEPIASSQAS